jgi:hypothetical protein
MQVVAEAVLMDHRLNLLAQVVMVVVVQVAKVVVEQMELQTGAVVAEVLAIHKKVVQVVLG